MEDPVEDPVEDTAEDTAEPAVRAVSAVNVMCRQCI